jgi:hypothetical protein
LTKLVLPFLETMATQVCNLSCHGCTNYSDMKHVGYVTWADAKQQLESWLAMLEIPDFGIMGGEPLINPEIHQWLMGVRQLMPKSQIRFTTNGVLLDRHFDTVDLCHDLGNTVFKITVHENDPTVEAVIDRIFSSYAWKPIREFGIDRWITNNDFRLQINRPERFIKTYQGTYNTMMPWSSAPAESFAYCVQKTCPLLYQGSIYKCSTQALLKPTLDRFGNPNHGSWAPYLIDGIRPTDGHDMIQQFVENFGKPHDICAMCPTAQDQAAVIEHQITVKRK